VADFHSLRHTFVSNLARGGVHPKMAMELARHKSLDLTLGVYTHVLQGDKAAALTVLPSLASPDDVEQAAALAKTGTDDRDDDPDDDPKRRTKRRFSGGSTRENMADGGEQWREPGQEQSDRAVGRKSCHGRKINKACQPVTSPVATAPGGTRTRDLRIRNPLLYPTELPAQHSYL